VTPIPAALLWIAFAFLCGSLPLSYWIGRLFLATDIRQHGDHNPGAANVFKAGGKTLGFVAILADGLKGLIPVALARYVGDVEGWALAMTCLAPIAGHAFTPFLRFQGGKALSVSFGVWAGLTTWQGPIVLGLAFAFWLKALAAAAWAVMAGMLTLLAVLLLVHAPWVWLVVWLGNFLILVFRHKDELGRLPDLHAGWLGRFLPRR
jgi:glycerol-3-phosphate acyltransferase PlsY